MITSASPSVPPLRCPCPHGVPPSPLRSSTAARKQRLQPLAGLLRGRSAVGIGRHAVRGQRLVRSWGPGRELQAVARDDGHDDLSVAHARPRPRARVHLRMARLRHEGRRAWRRGGELRQRRPAAADLDVQPPPALLPPPCAGAIGQNAFRAAVAALMRACFCPPTPPRHSVQHRSATHPPHSPLVFPRPAPPAT